MSKIFQYKSSYRNLISSDSYLSLSVHSFDNFIGSILKSPRHVSSGGSEVEGTSVNFQTIKSEDSLRVMVEVTIREWKGTDLRCYSSDRDEIKSVMVGSLGYTFRVTQRKKGFQ